MVRPTIIHKSPAQLRVPPNLTDLDAERSRFSWAAARAELTELPGGGLNIAHNAVTRHARGPDATTSPSASCPATVSGS